jgi:LacI family transcriptional regulator, galactose operon repressor
MSDLATESGLSVGTVSPVHDIPEAQLQHPGLRSVATYPELVGAEAARLLLERLDAPGARPRQVVLKPRLHVRASSTASDGYPQDRGEGRS